MSTGPVLPDVTLHLDDGSTTSLSQLVADGPVVVFFYPKAFTGGCTAEACHFRDLDAEFTELGATRLGISRDDIDTQQRFATEHELGYPLAADPDGTIAKAFGVKRPGPLWSKRHTFVVDSDLTVLATIKSETDMERHADEALTALRDRAAG